MSGLNDYQLRQLIIVPTLTHLDLHSPAAVQLVLATARAESGLEYLTQLGEGPARGLWQMEPETHDDIWINYLDYRDTLADQVRALAIGRKDIPDPEQMCGNLFYACAMTRIHYLRVPEPLPGPLDHAGLARYWKTYYNTELGKGTVDHFLMANSWDPEVGGTSTVA